MKKTKAARVVSLVSRVPLPARKVFFLTLFRIFFLMSRKHRLITVSNLTHAFPEKSPAEIDIIAKNVFNHFAVMVAEVFDIPFLTRENISRYLYPEDFKELERRMADKNGAILFTAHFGNWELLAASMAILVRPAVAVYRPLDNPFLDEVLRWIRTSGGNRLISKNRAMRQILRAIKKGEIVGMLIDQNETWQDGVFVDFFGRPACTTEGMALIAAHTGAPVMPLFLARDSSGKYRLISGAEVELVDTGDTDRDAYINTQNFTKVMEDVIRSWPDQWLWMHQRWKTKKIQAPKGRARDESILS